MADDLDLYDTSNFDPERPQYSTQNHRVLRKFKSETGSIVPKEFVGLYAKMYSLHVPDNDKQCIIRAKEIKKSYIKKNVRHRQFLDVLQHQKPTKSQFRAFRSRNHLLQ